jgi:AbrB family looped-hinge helix DNA binding protein
MSLVKVKRFAQVTLPPELRKRFHLAEGDYLEAEAVEQGILLKPVTVVERQQAWQQLFAATETVRPLKPSRKKGASKEEQDIATLVKESRKQR